MGSYDADRTGEGLLDELAAMRSRVAELEQSVAEREQDLLTKTLVEVILTLTSQTSHTAVLDQILRQVRRLVPCTTSNIMLLEGDVLRVAGWRGYRAFGSNELISSLAQPLSAFPLDAEVMRSRKPLIISDTHQEPLWVVMETTGWIRSNVMVPICLQDRVLGLLRLDSDTPGQFTAEDAENLLPLANAAAIALENARLYDQAQREIAQRNRTQEELRRLIDFNAGMVQNMAEGIIMVDVQGRFTFVNPAAAAMLGCSLSELVGQHWTGIVPSDQQPIVQAADERRARGEASRYELQLVGKDGRRFPVLVSGSPRFEQGRFVGTLAVFTDISELTRAEEEKRALQEKLARAQRMESLGVLAGGVAHELNNILGPLVAYPDLIMLDLSPDSPIRDDVLRIKQSAERAAAVVQDLLTLARRGAYRMIPLNLNIIVKDYCQSPSFAELTASYPYVYVDVNLAADLLNVAGSAPHLYKVVMNLMLNAFEAMPHGGRLEVTTECDSLDKPIVGYDFIEAGDYVVLKVSDTGVGIEEKNLGRIFEPFYTRKEMGRSGSGLGLAVVYGVVRDHDGRIDVQTEVGRGTDFSIYLPVTRETLQEEEEAKADYSGNETILVVDDLVEQRELAIKLLGSLGYKMEAVASGREAVAYLTENDVDLLVLDMIMEDDFDGLDTYREIVKSRPGQKAIIASGFSETARVKEAQRLGAGPFVKKPYTLESIGWAVHQELRGK